MFDLHYLINMCLEVFCLGFILFGTLWVSWTWVIISFPILGKFSTIISSSIFSWSFFFVFFFWDSYDSNVGAFDIVPEISEVVFISFNSFFFLPPCFIYFHHSIFHLTYPIFCLKADSLPTEPPGNHKRNQTWTRWLFTVCLPQQTLGVPTSCKS